MLVSVPRKQGPPGLGACLGCMSHGHAEAGHRTRYPQRGLAGVTADVDVTLILT